MNEPKRRGRPPKVEAVEGEAPVKFATFTSGVAEGVRRLDPNEPVLFYRDPFDLAQAYARRIWSGQSVSLSRHERMGRVRAALEAQGLSMEGVELP